MSDRLAKIVAALQVRPSDRVLEIGCGHGVAASMICDALTTGSLVAIDRSAKMIAAARKRNAVHVKNGKATFIRATLEQADFGAQRFDKILAVRVRLFHDDSKRAETLAKRWLAPLGKLLSVYDEP